MQHGLMSLAVLDPRFTHTMISVTVWVEGTAEEVRGRLLEGASMKVTQASSAAQIALVDISVAAGTLEANARKLFQGMRITAQQAAKLVRTGFSGLRGVAGSWELLLAIGGLYLQYDSLSRNQDKAETEIGPKAHEAKLALHGSQLGILGGQIELIGLVMRSSASAIRRPWAEGAAITGEATIKIGAVLSAVAGVFDTVQAILAIKRTMAAGDTLAAKKYVVVAFAYGLGTVAFAVTVFKPFVFGPLGLAVTLTLIAYELSKRAEPNDSTDLERWVRRCYFGLANETPSIHWNAPEFSDIAFAELNAATLGVQAKLHFESSLATDPTLPKIGGLVSLNTVQQLRFLAALPRFTKAKSAYRWKLIAHRFGDGTFPDFVGGETIASGDYLAHATKSLSPSSSFSKFSPPRHPDYASDFSIDENQRPYAVEDGSVQLEISGVVPLVPMIGTHSLLAATLLIMYWPDRNLPDAYIEVCSREMNE
ncbi:oxidoreductase [Pseudomonas monteilii]|nr:oxidoreductase [Pseudomonas monteilii]